MSRANTELYEGRICAFCQHWDGNAHLCRDHSNPSVYEYDQSAKGRCECHRQVVNANFRCKDFEKNYVIR